MQQNPHFDASFLESCLQTCIKEGKQKIYLRLGGAGLYMWCMLKYAHEQSEGVEEICHVASQCRNKLQSYLGKMRSILLAVSPL